MGFSFVLDKNNLFWFVISYFSFLLFSIQLLTERICCGVRGTKIAFVVVVYYNVCNSRRPISELNNKMRLLGDLVFSLSLTL